MCFAFEHMRRCVRRRFGGGVHVRRRRGLRPCCRIWRAHDGQATIEAAFALPVLMLLTLLLLQPGIVLYDRIVMQNAAAEGCRLLATAGSGDSQTCEDFIRRRLSAVPQVDIFHVHGVSCTWDIQMTGDETAKDVAVYISTEVKPLPLIDSGAALLGLLNSSGNLVISVECSAQTQPEWVFSDSDSISPEDWIGSWL